MVLVVLSAVFDIVCCVLKFLTKPLEKEDPIYGDPSFEREYVDLDPLVYTIVAISFIILVQKKILLRLIIWSDVRVWSVMSFKGDCH